MLTTPPVLLGPLACLHLDRRHHDHLPPQTIHQHIETHRKWIRKQTWNENYPLKRLEWQNQSAAAAAAYEQGSPRIEDSGEIGAGAGDGANWEREMAVRNPRRRKRAWIFAGTASRSGRLLRLCVGEGKRKGTKGRRRCFKKTSSPVGQKGQGIIYSLFLCFNETPWSFMNSHGWSVPGWAVEIPVFFSEDWKVVEGFRVLSATKIRDLPNPSVLLENWSTPTKNRSNLIKTGWFSKTGTGRFRQIVNFYTRTWHNN
jgi:hypothetical protein